MKRAKTKTRHLSLILDLGAGKKSAKIALPPESCSFPTIPIFHSLSRSCFSDVTLGGAWRDIQKTAARETASFSTIFQLCSTKSHFLQLLPHSFLPLSLSFFIVMSIYALFWNSFMVHPLLHARPRELAFLYCNITMTAGLFSYRVLLSDLDKRWCRTSAGSHFGRF